MITLILNPAARHGRVRKLIPLMDEAAKKSGLAVTWCESRSARHCVELAREAAGKSTTVVAVGGDGTVNQVATGILQAEERPPMAVIPVGTGNDFAHMFESEKDVAVFLTGLAEATTHLVDVGALRWEDRSGEHRGIFLNAAGVGFDGATNIEAVRFKALPGSRLGYLVAVLNTLRTWPNPPVQARWLGEDGTAEEYEGSLLLADAGNGRRVGGGFYLTPDAALNDGLLDLCLVRGASAWRVLRILPLALKPGTELGRQPEVIARRIRSVRISSSTDLPVHSDGEIVSDSCRCFDVSIIPAGLEVRVVPGRRPVTRRSRR